LAHISRIDRGGDFTLQDTVPDTAAGPVEQIQPEPSKPSRGGSRLLLSLFWVGAGVNHFVNPRFYEAIVPPSLKDEAAGVVRWSGVAELIGGVGVLVPATRRISGLWLIGVLAAVFPANLYMARAPEDFKKLPRWALFARLPLQPLMMIWAWRATRS
jgi:uncharacterized membrane protein